MNDTIIHVLTVLSGIAGAGCLGGCFFFRRKSKLLFLLLMSLGVLILGASFFEVDGSDETYSHAFMEYVFNYDNGDD